MALSFLKLFLKLYMWSSKFTVTKYDTILKILNCIVIEYSHIEMAMVIIMLTHKEWV